MAFHYLYDSIIYKSNNVLGNVDSEWIVKEGNCGAVWHVFFPLLVVNPCGYQSPCKFCLKTHRLPLTKSHGPWPRGIYSLKIIQGFHLASTALFRRLLCKHREWTCSFFNLGYHHHKHTKMKLDNSQWMEQYDRLLPYFWRVLDIK